MNEPMHTTSARSSATLENEGRLKVDAGRSKRRRFLKKKLKSVVNKNKYDV